MTAAGWAALPKAIQDEAEFAYESFFGMPMPDEDTAASPPTELGAQDGT